MLIMAASFMAAFTATDFVFRIFFHAAGMGEILAILVFAFLALAIFVRARWAWLGFALSILALVARDALGAHVSLLTLCVSAIAALAAVVLAARAARPWLRRRRRHIPAWGWVLIVLI